MKRTKKKKEYYAKNMEPELSIHTTTTRKKAIVSEEVEIAEEEKLREIAGEEIEEEAERWREKWADERMERRALEDEVKELKNKLDTFRDDLKRERIHSLYTLRESISPSKEEALEMKEELNQKFDWYNGEDNLLFYGDGETLVSPPPNPSDFNELDLEQITELSDYLLQRRSEGLDFSNDKKHRNKVWSYL